MIVLPKRRYSIATTFFAKQLQLPVLDVLLTDCINYRDCIDHLRSYTVFII